MKQLKVFTVPASNVLLSFLKIISELITFSAEISAEICDKHHQGHVVKVGLFT